jgi:hypothetical protein
MPRNARLVSACRSHDPLMEDTTIYITFQLTETPPYAVVDTYTGNSHSAQGLSRVYAVRFGDVPTANACCMTNSTAPNYIGSACTANLTPGFQNLAYVGVSQAPCIGKPMDATCGRPLVNLNIPAINRPALLKQAQTKEAAP